MGVIKTALEIALEKTETVKSDKTSIDQFEARQNGKKAANAFLTGELDLAGEIKSAFANNKNKNLVESYKQGIFDVLITQITLPARNEDKPKIEKLGKGLAIIVNNNEFMQMFKQLLQIISQYLEEVSQYEQILRQQYAPKLRQKEEELSRRLGRELHIDPMQDPEFITFYNQNMNALKGKYEPVIEQAKEETKRMFNEK